MAAQDWDVIVWRRANDLLQRAERIHRNFLRYATASQYRATHGRSSGSRRLTSSRLTKVCGWCRHSQGLRRIKSKFASRAANWLSQGERPLPQCCSEGQLKLWEIPLGRFERRLQLVGGEKSFQLQAKVSFEDGLLIIELRKQS